MYRLCNIHYDHEAVDQWGLRTYAGLMQMHCYVHLAFKIRYKTSRALTP